MMPTIIDEFTPLLVSRQRKAQLRAKRDGRCMTCFRPRTNYATLCDACQAKQRTRLGFQPWRMGGPGRIPHSRKPAPLPGLVFSGSANSVPSVVNPSASHS